MALKLFGRTKELERQVDEFLDVLADSALTFRKAIHIYLKSGASTDFMEKVEQIVELETRGDHLTNSVELEMYRETLIPDARGDVLSLLESLDAIINAFKGVLWYFATETPAIPDDLKPRYDELSELTCVSVESLVVASRSFFRDPQSVKDHLHKVRYHEKEADKIVTNLRRDIFGRDVGLAEKIHLRFFAERIVWISDMAEDVADDLAIYAIKRSI